MIWSLIKKELRLHRDTLYFALAILPIWIVIYLGSSFRGYPGDRLVWENSVFLVRSICVLGPLAVVFPMLVGASLIAWERHEGLLDSMLCLPVSRRRQWMVKVGVAICLALSIGGILQFLITQLMPLILVHSATKSICIGALAFILVAVSTYFSSICRDSFSALLGSFLFCIAFPIVAGIIDEDFFYLFSLTNGVGILAIRMLILVVTLFGLAGHNYMAQEFSARRVALHFAIICLLLVAMVYEYQCFHVTYGLIRH